MKKIQVRFSYQVSNNDGRSESDVCVREHSTNFPSGGPELESELVDVLLEEHVRLGWVSSTGCVPQIAIVNPIDIILDGIVVENE